MTDEQFIRANEIKKQLESAKHLLQSTQLQTTEWITFGYGNGSSESRVCTNLEIIEQVRAIIIKSHEKKIKELEKEFAKI